MNELDWIESNRTEIEWNWPSPYDFTNDLYSNKLKLDWILITFLAVVAMSCIQYTL